MGVRVASESELDGINLQPELRLSTGSGFLSDCRFAPVYRSPRPSPAGSLSPSLCPAQSSPRGTKTWRE